jgi:hypothetical protein
MPPLRAPAIEMTVSRDPSATWYEATFDMDDDEIIGCHLGCKMNPVFVPRTLPVVLSREEVASLIAATRKPQTPDRLSRSPTARACAPAKSQR